MLGLLGQDPLDFERLLRWLHTHAIMLTCTAYKARRTVSTMQHTANFVEQHCVHASTQRIFARLEILYTCCTCDDSCQHARIGWVCLTMVPSLCSRRLPAAKGIVLCLLLRLSARIMSARIMTASMHHMTASASVSHQPCLPSQASSGSAHRLSHQPCLHPPSECSCNRTDMIRL